MINEQLVAYVATERARGVIDTAISDALLTQGWKEEDIASVMGVVAQAPRTLSFENLFEGRLGRWQYFLTSILLSFSLIFMILSLGFVLGLVSGISKSGMSFVAMFIAFVPLAIVLFLSLSLMVRRAHDLNWNGWYLLLPFVPIANIVFALLMLFKVGTEGPNTYGPPQVDRNFKNTLLNL